MNINVIRQHEAILGLSYLTETASADWNYMYHYFTYLTLLKVVENYRNLIWKLAKIELNSNQTFIRIG